MNICKADDAYVGNDSTVSGIGFETVSTPPGVILAQSGGHSVTKMIKHIWKDESGASAAEYALILAIVGTAIAAAAITLGTAIGGAMNNAADCINNAGC